MISNKKPVAGNWFFIEELILTYLKESNLSLDP